MSIASAFNEITTAHGGTASKSGSIASAIDALNDALAGSDQQGAETIEDAVRLLGQHIGGGSASGTIEITENGEYDVSSYATADVEVSGGVDIGSLVDMPGVSRPRPIVGNDVEFISVLDKGFVSIGEDNVCLSQSLFQIATGTTLHALYSDYDSETIHFYDVTVNEAEKYATVNEIPNLGSIEMVTFEGQQIPAIKLVIPALSDGHVLVMWLES